MGYSALLMASLRLLSIPAILGLALTGLQADPPELIWSHSRSLMDEPFELSLTTDPPDAEIRYTLDASFPSPDHGERYTGPLQIDKTTIVRAMATNALGESTVVETQSYLYVDQVAQQEAYPDGYVREIISGRNGPARPHTFDWAMDPEVLDDPANGDLASHLLELPSLSLVMALDDFNFIYSHHLGRGETFERAASVELIYPDTAAYADFDGIQIDCGIRMQGGGAGDQARKKSFRLLFKKIYGKGTLNYPLFESAVHFGGNAATSFEGVVLRGAGNTNWSKDDAWKHEPSTYLRDPLVRDSQIAISGIGSRSIFVHLYINGYYFGLYNIAERPEENFMASYLGGEADDYYAINHGGSLDGDPQRWRDTVSAASLSNLHNPANYEAITERLNIDAYCDYILLNWYVGMGDWPWNNFFGGVSNSPPGKLHFFCWDSEYAFWTIEGYLRSNPTGWVNANFPRDGGTIASLWRALTANDDFVMAFADRVYRHCFNDGALTDANMKARFERLAALIENPIVAESARWGDSAWGREDDPHTRANDWIPNRDAVLDLIDGNVEIFVDALRDEGLYPDLDPPAVVATKDGSGWVIALENPNPTGSIYYTLNGTDPRLAGGTVSPSAIRYAEPVTLQGAQVLKTRVIQMSLFGDSTSSPLHEHLYLDETIGYPLRITEVMYHPETSEALEFLELQNVSDAVLDLTGFYFEGIGYWFKPGAQLGPREIAVLIPNDDPNLFAETYPEVTVFDTYKRHLGNEGETIAIFDGLDRPITAIIYDDDGEQSWPTEADGGGYSLEAVDRISPATDAGQWRASLNPGGTPGFVANIVLGMDSDLDGFDDDAEALAGTDPSDPHSFLRLEVIRLGATTIGFSFPGVADRRYTLQYRETLSPEGSWTAMATFPALPEDGPRTHEELLSDESIRGFYRLVVETD